MQVNHELIMTMGISQHSVGLFGFGFFFFFWSQVPFSKIYQFLTLSHSTNTKSKETYALTTPHRI